MKTITNCLLVLAILGLMLAFVIAGIGTNDSSVFIPWALAFASFCAVGAALQDDEKTPEEKRELPPQVVQVVPPVVTARLDTLSVGVTQLEDDVEKLKLALHLRQVAVPSKS